jgi:hypothetical protein
MNIPTIEELDRIGLEAANLAAGSSLNGGNLCIYVEAIRDAVVAACRPQLRPIAETPAEVPEGYERLYGILYDGGGLAVTSFLGPKDTHFIDIALPGLTYPADFEQAFKESGLDAKDKDAAFKLWKGGAK